MSTLLERMAEIHTARMTAHDAMLRHLRIDPGPDDALVLADELRASLLGCARCICPCACAVWVEDGNNGHPPWCCATSAFRDLAEARNRLGKQQTS